MLALMNHTKQKAQEGDAETQNIYEQIALAREMDQLHEELDGNGEPANEPQTTGDDASMQDASDEPQKDDQA
eukprot:2201094-Amphidinium_carterae.1